MNILEARRRILGGEVYKRTAEGNPISVKSVARMRPGLTVYGKSTQETTTGAQLFDYSNIQNVVTDASGAQHNGEEISGLPAGKYTISSRQKTIGTICYLYAVVKTASGEFGSVIYIVTNINILTRTVTINNGDSIIIYDAHNHTLELSKSLFEEYGIMLNAGSTALPWEPYTGGQPSPSPDYPQEIKSAGDDGNIAITLSNGADKRQTLTAQTPNGLPGIPVNSGGNYTDENGQQWVCDEIDFKRGKYVKRIWKTIFNGSDNEKYYSYPSYKGFYIRNILPEICKRRKGFSNQMIVSEISHMNTQEIWIGVDDKNVFFVSNEFYNAELSDYGILNWRSHLTQNPLEIMTYLENPIETDLSAEEIAAYQTTHTYSPTTTVTNDAEAWMRIDYKTKKEPGGKYIMLGKIVNGVLTYPPHRIVIDGMQIFNPTEEQLISTGWKTITETPMPEDPAPEEQHCEAQYTDSGGTITQSWVLVEDEPVETGKTIDERVTVLEQDISGISTAIERGLTL